jgi:hypothetical protein
MGVSQSTHRPVVTLIIVITAVLVSGCDTLREVFSDIGEPYETVIFSPDPGATATFSTSDYGSCPFRGLSTSALGLPLHQGVGPVAVGNNGLFNPGNEMFIHTMQGAIKFDVSSIPVGATNVAALLRFDANLTARSESGDPCSLPIDRVERATVGWNRSTDFEAVLPSAPIEGARCTRTAASFTCTVSLAVQNWSQNPALSPNNGFVVHGPATTYDACGGVGSGTIGPPGNYLECAAVLSDIELEVSYIPPG